MILYFLLLKENNALFIMTNMIITPNQTQSHCPEDPRFTDNHCTTDEDCTPLEPVRNGNGRIVSVLFLPNKHNSKQGW